MIRRANLITLSILLVVFMASTVLADDNWDSKPMTLTVLTATSIEPSTRDVEQEITEEFMKLHPNIKVQIDGIPSNDQHTKVVTLGTVGQLPDVVQDHVDWIPSNVEGGFFADLSKFADKQFFDQYLPGSMELCSYKGKIYALQVALVNTGLLYRKDLFEAAGVKEPTNWEEFLAVCQKLTKDTNKDGKIDQWGFGMMGKSDRSSWLSFTDMAYPWGFEVIQPTPNGGWKAVADKPENIQAIKYYAELYNEYNVTPPGTLENSYMEIVRALALGQCAIMATGSHSIGNATAVNPEVGSKLASAPFPKGKTITSRPFAVAWSISAKTSPEKQKAAFEYIKFFTNEQNQIKWSKATLWVPTMKSALSAPHLKDPVFSGFVRATNYLYVPPITTLQAKIEDYGINALQKALLKKEPYAQIMKTFNEQLEKAIKEAGLDK